MEYLIGTVKSGRDYTTGNNTTIRESAGGNRPGSSRIDLRAGIIYNILTGIIVITIIPDRKTR